MGTTKDSKLQIDLSIEQQTLLVQQTWQRIETFFRQLPSMPVEDQTQAHDLSLRLKEKLPSSGAAFDEILNLVFGDGVRKGISPASGGFFGYVVGGGLFQGAIADLIAASINKAVTFPHASPLLIQLEANTIRWCCEMLGFPDSARGTVTSGGSQSNFIALVCARMNRQKFNHAKSTVYFSSQMHHSLLRAARLSGLADGQIRIVKTNAKMEMDLGALEQMLLADKKADMEPLLVAATAGTTNTGAIDDLKKIAAIATRNNCWFHVDAAYGGFFRITSRGQAVLDGISLADSITLDPHKSLHTPFGSGVLLVKDPEHLKRVFSARPEYIPFQDEDEDIWNIHFMSPDQSRGFKAMRIWLPLKMHGVNAFQESLDQKLDLAQVLYQGLLQIPDLKVLDTPKLSIVPFHVLRSNKSQEELNALTKDLLGKINAKGRCYVSGTLVDDRFYIRPCVLNFRTGLEHVQNLIADIKAGLSDLS